MFRIQLSIQSIFPIFIHFSVLECNYARANIIFVPEPVSVFCLFFVISQALIYTYRFQTQLNISSTKLFPRKKFLIKTKQFHFLLSIDIRGYFKLFLLHNETYFMHVIKYTSILMQEYCTELFIHCQQLLNVKAIIF